MTKKEEFELASKAFSLMTAQEQGIVLVLFRNHKELGTIECWIAAIHKVCKSVIKIDE